MGSVSGEFNLDGLGREAASILKKQTDRVLSEVTNQAKMNAPVRDGTLRTMISFEPATMETPFRASGKVVSEADYSAYVHEGTGPYIYPTHAKALRFTVGGKTIFAKYVRGVKARPFLANAAEQVAKNYQ